MTGGPWQWMPDAAELVRDLPCSSSSAAWASVQLERWEGVNGVEPVDVFGQVLFRGGSLLWVDSALEALLLRDALRYLGHVAVRLWDTAASPTSHLVITSRLPL